MRLHCPYKLTLHMSNAEPERILNLWQRYIFSCMFIRHFATACKKAPPAPPRRLTALPDGHNVEGGLGKLEAHAVEL